MTLHDQILSYIRTLGDDIVEKEQYERIAFSSYSKRRRGKPRLVWVSRIEYSGTPDCFWVWVRKDSEYVRYPDFISKISAYSRDGGYGNPAFKITNKEDLNKVKEIISFAYNHL